MIIYYAHLISKLKTATSFHTIGNSSFPPIPRTIGKVLCTALPKPGIHKYQVTLTSHTSSAPFSCYDTNLCSDFIVLHTNQAFTSWSSNAWVPGTCNVPEHVPEHFGQLTLTVLINCNSVVSMVIYFWPSASVGSQIILYHLIQLSD